MRYLLIIFFLLTPGLASAKERVVQEPDVIRCRMIKELGSRIPKRECKTNAEWARLAEEAREAMANRNRASHCGGEQC